MRTNNIQNFYVHQITILFNIIVDLRAILLTHCMQRRVNSLRRLSHTNDTGKQVGPKGYNKYVGPVIIAVTYVTKSRTVNYDFRACARARGFPGSTLFGRTHMLRRVCRAITR